MQNQSASLPRGVQIFIVAHLLAVAVIGMAAALVGESHESATAANSDHMRLVPLTVAGAADASVSSLGVR